MDHRSAKKWLDKGNEQFTAGLWALVLFTVGVFVQFAGYYTGIMPTLFLSAVGIVAAIALVWSFLAARHSRGNTLPHVMMLAWFLIVVSMFGGTA